MILISPVILRYSILYLLDDHIKNADVVYDGDFFIYMENRD